MPIEIYKDGSGHYWINGLCNTIRDLCGEQCEEGCSVFDAVQQIGRELETKSEDHVPGAALGGRHAAARRD